MKAALIRLGIRGFKPELLKVALDRGQISSNPLAQKVTAFKSGTVHGPTPS